MSTHPVRVAVGVVRNSLDQVLIALRPAHKHQGDLWEFPGGKIELGESCEQALARELEEELGIAILHSRPLINIPFDYSDKSVLLEVREVLAFQGTPHGHEGQPLRWVPRNQLSEYSFPTANRRILKALELPELLAITNDFSDEMQFCAGLKRALSKGAGMIHIRAKALVLRNVQGLLRLAADISPIPVVVNSGVDRSVWGELPGLHLRSCDLMSISSRPISHECWLGASCHNVKELRQAARIHVDYVCLSPVCKTESHLDGDTLGWEGFARLAEVSGLPSYALGGLGLDDLGLAKAHGAVGIAGIGMFCG